MTLAAQARTKLIKEHQRTDGDTGSPEVQVAILTGRMAELQEHLQGHDKDHSSRRGLLMMVSKRNRLLKYLARTNRESYQALIKRLGLRK